MKTSCRVCKEMFKGRTDLCCFFSPSRPRGAMCIFDDAGDPPRPSDDDRPGANYLKVKMEREEADSRAALDLGERREQRKRKRRPYLEAAARVEAREREEEAERNDFEAWKKTMARDLKVKWHVKMQAVVDAMGVELKKEYVSLAKAEWARRQRAKKGNELPETQLKAIPE